MQKRPSLIRIISYNLRKHRAGDELTDLALNFSADVLCLQECDALELADTIGPLQLADATRTNRLGLAIYYHPDRFTALQTQAFTLKKSLHDRLLAPAHERLIGTLLIDRQTKGELAVGSFHAAPLTASNALRRKQIRAAHAHLLRLGREPRTLMVGDFNYPFFTKNLAARARKAGYDLSLSDQRTYTRYKMFKGHFDFATSRGLDIQSVETLPRGKSDHMKRPGFNGEC